MVKKVQADTKNPSWGCPTGHIGKPVCSAQAEDPRWAFCMKNHRIKFLLLNALAAGAAYEATGSLWGIVALGLAEAAVLIAAADLIGEANEMRPNHDKSAT